MQVTKTDEEAEKRVRIEKSALNRQEINEGVGMHISFKVVHHACTHSFLGLRHVMDALRRSHKPIVGHNVFIDLAHLYHVQSLNMFFIS